MEVGLVHKIDIDQEMQQAYLDYAMSVIVARALPDARDGLKPVHRRILYAMYDMGLRADSTYKKSARIVGEVLGKYHPHGDMAVYDAMARMAQDFSMRYLLVDGQGNFGSVDGDPPAAMRYTEARLTRAAIHMLTDIEKNTVNYADNFDATLQEPLVLPSAIPNLLVNGATGIAVGMATSIPPHNLGEIVDAMHHMLEKWEKMDDLSVEDLMHFVQGPDFPTGGVIIHEAGENSLVSAYSTGRGRVTIQARAHLEEMERGRSRVIVTELPYMTNKSSLIERIAELAREERLEGIVDLRDESDRQGMRIVIELSKTRAPEDVLRDLYRHTPMQSTFSINMLALVDNEPRLLSLKQSLRVYLEHRIEIVRRRSEYDLERARQRAHILEGYRVALKNLDEVIDLIRKAPDVETARTRLMKRFRLSEIQAQAILDLQLRRLAALERKKIEEEYKEVLARIKELEALLRSPKKMRQVVGDELAAVKEAYGDRRRTHIVQLKEGERVISLLASPDLVPEKATWLAVSPQGLISRSPDDRLPRLTGKDAPAWLIQATTRDTLYLVCEQGEAAALPMHAIPESEAPSEGIPLEKVSALREGNKLAALFVMPARPSRESGENAQDNRNILTTTRQGMVKKSPVSDLPGPSAGLFTLVKVNPGDQLGWLKVTNGQNDVLLFSAQGMAIRFSEDEVRPMGLVAAGVMGLKLAQGDWVAGMDLLPQQGDVFVIASDGSAKRIPTDQFPRQGRYGQGVTGWKLPAKVTVTGMVIGAGSQRAILHLEKQSARIIRLDEAPLQTRIARGKAIQELKSGGQVLRLTLPWESASAGRSSEQAKKGSRTRKPTASPATAKAPAARKTIKTETTPSKSGAPAAAGRSTRAKAQPASAPAKSVPAPAKPSKNPPAKPKASPSTARRSTGAKTQPKSTPARATPAPAKPSKTAPAKAIPAPAKPARATPAKPKAAPVVKKSVAKKPVAKKQATAASVSAPAKGKAKASPASSGKPAAGKKTSKTTPAAKTSGKKTTPPSAATQLVLPLKKKTTGK
ncbi:MAG: DNA gyrase subunit A [Anaerolineales bacterium]|nr:DNA gyrase subunit A [Anaerolineales bacterium]